MASQISGGEGTQVSGDVVLAQKRGKKTADHGSSKNPKTDEVDNKVPISGVERDGVQFLDGHSHHLLLKSGLADSGNSIVKLRKKPSWILQADTWMRGLVNRGLRSESVIVDKKPLYGSAFHLGFVYLPTDLRARCSDEEIPEWNSWDSILPTHFFNMSTKYLSDDGFLAVLHSGQFTHTSAIYAAAGSRGVFKPVQSYTIILPKPMWKKDSNFQVSFFVLVCP